MFRIFLKITNQVLNTVSGRTVGQLSGEDDAFAVGLLSICSPHTVRKIYWYRHIQVIVLNDVNHRIAVRNCSHPTRV